MTPELEPVERIFRRVAIARERPWPPDRFLGAIMRAGFSEARARESLAVLDRKLDELEAIRSMHEIVQVEARELVERVHAWSAVAEELLRVAAVEAPSSPWLDVELVEPDTRAWAAFDEAVAAMDRWALDATGAWAREGANDGKPTR